MKNKLTVTKEKINKSVFIIGVIFLVVFPKGGFKISEIPITWGFIYLGFISILSIIVLIHQKKVKISSNSLLSYMLSMPFLVYFTFNIIFKGYNGTLGNLISFYVNFGFLPFLFLFLLPYFTNKIDFEFISKVLIRAVFFVCIYGIFLFFYKAIFGHFLEIKYLTINAGDVGEMDTGKFNSRGVFSKLISTYNNGNIFGISILMLLPLVYKYTTSKITLFIVFLSLMLTLSRTVWLGVLFFLLIEYRKKLIQLIISYSIIFGIILVLAFIVSLTFVYNTSSTTFIFDANLGGRFKQLEAFSYFTLFGRKVYSVIEEIVYLSLYDQLGAIGLGLFILSFFFPIILYFKNSSKQPQNSVFAKGILIYLFCCFSDGAILLIPVLVFFYFCMNMMFNARVKNVG